MPALHECRVLKLFTIRLKKRNARSQPLISLDFIETKSRKEGNKTLLSPYPRAFEQPFCPGGGAFASSFSKNANSRGSARGGGGWGDGHCWN